MKLIKHNLHLDKKKGKFSKDEIVINVTLAVAAHFIGVTVDACAEDRINDEKK